MVWLNDDYLVLVYIFLFRKYCQLDSLYPNHTLKWENRIDQNLNNQYILPGFLQFPSTHSFPSWQSLSFVHGSKGIKLNWLISIIWSNSILYYYHYSWWNKSPGIKTYYRYLRINKNLFFYWSQIPKFPCRFPWVYDV